MKILDIVFFILILIILLVGLYFLYRSYSNIKKNAQYSTNSKVVKAASYMKWAMIVGILGLIMVVAASVFVFIYGDKAAGMTKKAVIGIILGITFVVLIISGVLSAMAAAEFKGSGSYSGTGSDSTAYNSAAIAAVMILGVSSLAVLAWAIVYFLRKPTRVQDLQKTFQSVYSQMVPTSGTKGVPAGNVSTTGTGTAAGTTTTSTTPVVDTTATVDTTAIPRRRRNIPLAQQVTAPATATTTTSAH